MSSAPSFRGFVKVMIGAQKKRAVKPIVARRICSNRFVMTKESHLRLALLEWVADRADLSAVVAGEEFEAILKRVFSSQGIETFNVLLEFLKDARKKYIAEHVAPGKRKVQRVGDRTSAQTKKGYAIYAKRIANGQKPEWNEIARDCLKNSGKSNTKATWQERVEKFRKAVTRYKERLQKEGRQHGK